jgi:hypothetical protein
VPEGLHSGLDSLPDEAQKEDSVCVRVCGGRQSTRECVYTCVHVLCVHPVPRAGCNRETESSEANVAKSNNQGGHRGVLCAVLSIFL